MVIQVTNKEELDIAVRVYNDLHFKFIMNGELSTEECLLCSDIMFAIGKYVFGEL